VDLDTHVCIVQVVRAKSRAQPTTRWSGKTGMADTVLYTCMYMYIKM